MGFLKSLLGDPSVERSFSREWIGRTGGAPRKTELAVAILNRLAADSLAQAEAFGSPISPDDLAEPGAVLDEILSRERSLSASVARDLGLLYQGFGCLGVNRERSLASVGLAPNGGEVPHVPKAAADLADAAIAIAEHFNDGGPTPRSREAYSRMFTEQAETEGYRRVGQIACWLALAIGRLRAAGDLDGDFPLFNSAKADPVPMLEPGWYPNPLNAGDTSRGDAQIERFWDGSDWTSRVRTREGRGWRETEVTLFQVMSN
jgi:hypothetical protein